MIERTFERGDAAGEHNESGADPDKLRLQTSMPNDPGTM